LLNKLETPCQDNGSEYHSGHLEFLSCFKRVLENYTSNLTCLPGGLKRETFSTNFLLKDCETKELAFNMTNELLAIYRELIIESYITNYCTMPCKRVKLKLNSGYTHINSLWRFLGQKDNLFLLNVYQSATVGEERIETLIYDAVGLISSVGGSLGLFLGFSCLSLVLVLIKCFIKCLKLDSEIDDHM